LLQKLEELPFGHHQLLSSNQTQIRLHFPPLTVIVNIRNSKWYWKTDSILEKDHWNKL